MLRKNRSIGREAFRQLMIFFTTASIWGPLCCFAPFANVPERHAQSPSYVDPLMLPSIIFFRRNWISGKDRIRTEKKSSLIDVRLKPDLRNHTRVITSDAFWPPKPKLLEIAVPSGISRDVLGT